jgi:hypothetical protein
MNIFQERPWDAWDPDNTILIIRKYNKITQEGEYIVKKMRDFINEIRTELVKIKRVRELKSSKRII